MSEVPPKPKVFNLLVGGILPVVAFTVIEEQYGPLLGTLAGMVFGLGEVLYEKIKFKAVSLITWIANGLILLLGGVAIFTQDGIWFKLQPSILAFAMSVFILASVALKKNIFVLMAEKQKMQIPDLLKSRFHGLAIRMGVFLQIHVVIGAWAAFNWSTKTWALLKGVGFTASFIVFLAGEALWLRKTLIAIQQKQKTEIK